MKIKAIYDNGGQTFDRYSVYFDSVEKVVGKKTFYLVLGMSAEPYHPLGFCQHSSGQLGRHNGKKIPFRNLPLDCQKAVKQELR